MENAKKTFISGINTDDSYFTQTSEDNLDALNVRVISSSEGKSGSISNVDGTRLIPNYQSFKNVKIIGSYEDPTTNNIFYFLVNKSNNSSVIYCYKSKEDNIFKVLSDSNLDSNYSLNFNPDKPITGVGYIDNILYWTGVDGREPFRINVERGIKTNLPSYVTTETAYVTPIGKSVVTLIRKPPMLPLEITVQEDSSRDTSFLKSRGHTFAYRYVYKDGETSVFSPTSHHYPNQDMDDDNHKTSRKIKVDFPKYEAEEYGISQDVQKIQFAVKFDNDTSYFIWKEFDNETHASLFTSQTFGQSGSITADFYNDVLGFAVDDSNSIKLYDTVPYEAEALSIARNRLFLGNIKEGRINPKKVTSADISLNLISQDFNESFNQYDRNRGGKVGFSHASAYQIGIAFYDFAGRTGGVLTDDSLKIITPERNLNLSSFNSVIEFNLNTTAKNLIPDWAEYYSIVRTKNLIKDFTITNMSDKIRYYTTDSNGSFTVNVENTYPQSTANDSAGLTGTPNGTFSDNELVTFDPSYEGIAIGLGDLTSYKQGYTYQEGDRVKIITENNVFEAAITGQVGKYVTINLIDFNSSTYLSTSSLSNKDYSVVYEIYSPHKTQPNEFYYEAFNGRIIRYDSAPADFSDVSGNLIGDIYLRSLGADTSDVEDFFFSGTGDTNRNNDTPIAGEIKYIDFPIFYGEGKNDLTANSGVNNGTQTEDYRFEIKITSTGTPDKFKWRKRNRNQVGANVSYSSEIDITGSAQALDNGVQITFASTTGHTINDRWIVNAKKADGAGLDEEPKKVYALYPSPPNGSILEGSSVDIHFHEFKSHDAARIIWDVSLGESEVTETYPNIEELFWETSLGTKILEKVAYTWERVSFRRGTINNGNGGHRQLHILNHETDPTSPVLSNSDGTVITMIIEGALKQSGKVIRAEYNIRIDYADIFNYSAESMNPSNDYFLNWIQITGKPNLVPTEVSSQTKNTGIVFSETKIPGSKINGLSKFSALDEKRLDDASGPLRSLKVTSKTQSTGSVMLAISENETTSIYLGEQQLQQTSSGGQFLSVSQGVIGTINTLKGSYGTKHPESIVINEGSAFWFDIKNQTVIRYDSNGLTPIGDVKMKTFFREKSEGVISEDVSEFIIGTYDDYNSEYIISFPKTGDASGVIQQDAYYPDTPIIDITNEGQTPSSKIISVTISDPFSIIKDMTVIDGVGTLSFTSVYDFTIASPTVLSPTGTNISVANASTGGFTTNADGHFAAGTGSLTFTNVFGDIEDIVIQLTRQVQPGSQSVSVSNILNYFNDSLYIFGSQTSGNTPLRITDAVDGFLYSEEKNITVSAGSLTIPCVATTPWQLGVSNNNTHNFTESKAGIFSNIASSRVSTNATAITESGTTIGYEAGSFNIVITGVDEDVDFVQIESRPLKSPNLGVVTFDNITSSSVELISSITLNRATQTEFGFVYSTTNTDPSIGASGVTKQQLSGDITNLSYNLTGLSADTTVYAKVYLISNFGTGYGSCTNVITGSASNSAPTVESTSYNTGNGSFTGTITSNGGSTAGTNGITERGWIYSSSDTTPTIGETGVVKLTSSQTSILSFPYQYTSSKVVLTSNTTFYWRAYAKNDIGTSYGLVQNFTTPNTSVGIGGFTLMGSTVGSSGGNVQVNVFKNTSTGTCSGTVTFSVMSSNYVIQTSSVSVAFTNTQTIDSVQVSVPGNFTGSSRSINLTVSSFNGITNITGQSTPISISGTITQLPTEIIE